VFQIYPRQWASLQHNILICVVYHIDAVCVVLHSYVQVPISKSNPLNHEVHEIILKDSVPTWVTRCAFVTKTNRLMLLVCVSCETQEYAVSRILCVCGVILTDAVFILNTPL
jgi:hypothetical protein